MKTVSVHDAVGMVLGHDLTQIVPGVSKGAAFQKGHIITKEDIPRLLDMGKERIFVWDLSEGYIHEDDAARRIAVAVAGKGITLSEPREGKIELLASHDGLLKINVSGVTEINSFPEVMFATIHTNQLVKKNKLVAGTRIIPLIVKDIIINDLEKKCKGFKPVIEVVSLHGMKVGIVTTGSEVFQGRIKDSFGPVLRKKIDGFGCTVTEQIFVPDSADKISDAIKSFINNGADAVLVTGGMSVDPDDVTPEGIRRAGAEIISYGAPVLPGAMFLMGYIGKIPIMGLPGCVMYHKITIFDLIFPRVQAGERISREDIISLAHGGLCQNCDVCRYPDCGFGK